MKHFCIVFFVLMVSGCAKTMVIENERLGAESASLTMDASLLKGFISIPLLSLKVVNVYLSEFPECVDGEVEKNKTDDLGKAVLTPKKHIQTAKIPSGIKLLVSTNSYENAVGNVYQCWNSLHFSPEKSKEYALKITPHRGAFITKKCFIEIFEKVEGKLQPLKSAVYPKVVYEGFWRGSKFDHCGQPK